LQCEKLLNENQLKGDNTNAIKKFLNDNQIEYLVHENTTNLSFDDKIVKKSLALLQKSRHNCYEFIRKQGYPILSYRTLMERLKNIHFSSGIQDELIKIVSSCISDQFVHCSLQIDEMQIQPCITYDNNSKTYSGFVNKEFVENNEKLVATHVLVYLLRDLKSDNKLIPAFYFTGNSVNGEKFWNTTQDVIKNVENNSKFRVHALVTDMCPANQSLWKAANIHSTRKSLSYVREYPCDNQRGLFQRTWAFYYLFLLKHLI
jgi:hypothetical protein